MAPISEENSLLGSAQTGALSPLLGFALESYPRPVPPFCLQAIILVLVIQRALKVNGLRKGQI